MAKEKDGKYGYGNTATQWNGGSRENYEKWLADKEKRTGGKTKSGVLNRLAKMKASSKKSKPSKIGDMLDRKEMEQAPRRPSVTKAKPTKMIMTKKMRTSTDPRMRKMKDK
jgi:hypothetical protein